MPRRGTSKTAITKARPRKVGLPWRLRLLLLLLIFLVVAAGWLLWPFWRLAGQFDPNPERQPSRLYGRATPLEVGQIVDREGLIEELRALGLSLIHI